MIKNHKILKEIFTPINNPSEKFVVLSPLKLKKLQLMFRNQRKMKDFNSEELEKIASILSDFTQDNEDLRNNETSMSDHESGLSTYNTSQPTESDKDSSKKTESDVQSDTSESEDLKNIEKIVQKKEEGEKELKKNPFDKVFPLLFNCFLGSDIPYFSPYCYAVSLAYSPNANLEVLVGQILKYYEKNEKDLLIFDDLHKYIFESEIGNEVCLIDITGEIWY